MADRHVVRADEGGALHDGEDAASSCAHGGGHTTPKAQFLVADGPDAYEASSTSSPNPELAASPVVPKGTAVRYYVAA